MVHVNVKSFCIIYKLYFRFYILTLDSNAGLAILNFCATLEHTKAFCSQFFCKTTFRFVP